MSRLSKTMTLDAFDKGYWYAHELKTFAQELGILNCHRERKDQLEKVIRHFLRTGEIIKITKPSTGQPASKDLEDGLRMSLQIQNYKGNKETKAFILREAQSIEAKIKIKSGVWYRLNRWREEQLEKANPITYGDLVSQFIALNKVEKFDRIPVVRYINFISDYLANEKNSTHTQATQAWKQLKELDIIKDYFAWKAYLASSQ